MEVQTSGLGLGQLLLALDRTMVTLVEAPRGLDMPVGSVALVDADDVRAIVDRAAPPAARTPSHPRRSASLTASTGTSRGGGTVTSGGTSAPPRPWSVRSPSRWVRKSRKSPR